MKTEYEHVRFREFNSWWTCDCVETGETIGRVHWCLVFERYYYSPFSSVYSPWLLDDISNFMKQLMEDRKSKAKGGG